MKMNKDYISSALMPLLSYNQFILYKLVPSKTHEGKFDKLPVNPTTLAVSTAHDRGAWLSYDECKATLTRLDDSYGVAFVFSHDDPFFFLDIDNCLQDDGSWNAIATELCSRLPEAAKEISQSGRGLHIFGVTSPVHHGCKNKDLGIELYTSDRFVALTDVNTMGNAAVDCTAQLQSIIDDHFTKSEQNLIGWRDTPVPEANPIESDDALIEKALNSKSAAGVFGNKATFRDLWFNDEAKLAQCYASFKPEDPYDRSSADAALAQMLAFWTGKNHNRMWNLMWQSQLVRDKWHPDNHKNYLTNTIMNAVGNQVNVYGKNQFDNKSCYKDIKSQMDQMGDRLTPEETITICKLTANASNLLTPEKEDIIDQLKKRSSLSSKKDIRQSIQEQSHEEVSSNSHPEIARTVIELLGEGNVIFSASTFWVWNGGVWVKVDDRTIRKIIQKVCMDKLYGNYTDSTVNSTLSIIKTELHNPDHKFNDNTDTNMINTLNGELHFLEGQWVLKSHFRENYFTTQIPVNYEPAATAPRFIQFLNEIFAGDSDGSDKVKVLLQMIGYTMLPTCQYEKFIMLIGNGANGKSVLLALVEALIGKNNVCAVLPSQFDNKFQRAHLHGKAANIVTEIREGEIIADAQLKAIVSGELTTAEYKNKDPFDFHPIVTCWFGTNHMPHTRDFSGAFFRRSIVLELNNSFEGAKRDTKLIKKLIQELPGILNMVLIELSAAILNDGISTSESIDEAKRQWRYEADQVVQFVDEKCTPDQNSRVDFSSIYFEYQSWAKQSGINRVLSKKSFGNRLTKMGYVAGKGTGGIRQRFGLSMTSISYPQIY
jgi:P4 family phage/plasmid primase-like protien